MNHTTTPSSAASPIPSARTRRPALARAAATLALALLACSAARAGTVQVKVTGQDGKPAANVVVQVTTIVAAARSAAAPTMPVLVIEQRDLQFSPYLNVVQTGTTARFVNRDPYDHHVRSTPGGPLGSIPPAKSFELRLAALESGAHAKPKTAEVLLDKPGIIGLGCHIHGSMRGHLLVTDTPYFAKTDADGLAKIEQVPDGAAELKVWHPDQFIDQAAQKLQVTAAPLEVAAPLNFSPKARRVRGS
jgi:plastocyanin